MSVVPFLAADGALLLTAGVIAWRASGELAGGALLAVVVCVGLGAVLAVLPWLLNDAREREAALAERQRELADLVNTSTANASRWGTQWAAAATGLEDAAKLASRSIATAERLPAVLEERANALAERLAATEREVVARLERAAALAGEAAVRTEEARTARAELAQSAADLGARVEAGAAKISMTAAEAEARLAATTEALSQRLAAVEAMIGEVAAQLERVAALPVPTPTPAPAPVAAPVMEPVTAQAVPVAPVAEKPAVVVKSEAIMDPFLIPEDGYASLAEAMDARNA